MVLDKIYNKVQALALEEASGKGTYNTSLIDKTTGLSLGVDKSTGALEIIDYAHHEIHAGSHFTCIDSQAVDTTTQSGFRFRMVRAHT